MAIQGKKHVALLGAAIAVGGFGLTEALAQSTSDVPSLQSNSKRGANPNPNQSQEVTIWDLFRNSTNPNTTVEVNKYLWVAALDILNFLPVETVDPFTGSLNPVTAWSIIGGITHAFTERWSTNITTSYLDADVDGSERSRIGDFKNFDFQANVIYTPVESLDIGVEVDYKYVQRQYGNDLNGLVGTFRIERTF